MGMLAEIGQDLEEATFGHDSPKTHSVCDFLGERAEGLPVRCSAGRASGRLRRSASIVSARKRARLTKARRRPAHHRDVRTKSRSGRIMTHRERTDWRSSSSRTTAPAGWRPCLSSVYAKSGNLELDVVVVDSGSTDDTVDLVRREFPDVRVLTTENRGFASANNRGLEVVDAEWVLFLNPDTRILSGTLEELVSLLRARPTVGLAGVRQIDENGVMDPTMRRFPNAVRSLFASLGAERLPFRAVMARRTCARPGALRSRDACDWTVGSFMLARKAAIDDVGGMDERFFLYCEETDFCLRIRQAGWSVVHLPQMTIFHQSRSGSDALSRQMAFARRQYMAKHFAPSTESRARLRSASGTRSAPSRPDAGRRPPPTASARSALATLSGSRRRRSARHPRHCAAALQRRRTAPAPPSAVTGPLHPGPRTTPSFHPGPALSGRADVGTRQGDGPPQAEYSVR